MATGIPNMWSFWTPRSQVTWYGACTTFGLQHEWKASL